MEVACFGFVFFVIPLAGGVGLVGGGELATLATCGLSQTRKDLDKFFSYHMKGVKNDWPQTKSGCAKS